MPSIFSKIIAGKAPAEIVYKDEYVTAFKDINPQAPVHILIVTNKEIPTLNEADKDDEAALGRMLIVAAKIAAEYGIAETGYRLIMNCNHDAGQEVFHIHMHLLGGYPLGRMISVKGSRK